MSDIAGAVDVGPSALYRHFPGKQALLHEIIESGLTKVERLMADLEPVDRASTVSRLSSLALDERHLGAILYGEVWCLNADNQARVRRQVRAIGTQLTSQVCAARPELNGHAADLIAWLVLVVLASPSFHRADLARPGYDALLAELVATVLDAPIRPDFPAPEAATSPQLTPQLRSEA